jgi:ATP-binding cassette subfamily B protein
MSHFVVVFRITKKYVIVGDPAKDIERISIDDFYKKFTGAMLLLKPNSEFEREKIKGTKLFGFNSSIAPVNFL